MLVSLNVGFLSGPCTAAPCAQGALRGGDRGGCGVLPLKEALPRER